MLDELDARLDAVRISEAQAPLQAGAECLLAWRHRAWRAMVAR
jgi:hypothetical protein